MLRQPLCLLHHTNTNTNTTPPCPRQALSPAVCGGCCQHWPGADTGVGDAGRAAKGLSQLTQPLARGPVLAADHPACPSIPAHPRASRALSEGPSIPVLCQQPWEELVASSASQQVLCPKPPITPVG